VDLSTILDPSTGLGVPTILAISFLLGLLHGATPDEHTWPITFSYSVGQYSTRGGMKAGFAFSAGFTAQRALLTTLGFLGLAAVYEAYNLDGPVYVLVGIAMFVAGSYVLRGKYVHIPFDALLRGRQHHTAEAERLPLHEAHAREVPVRMAVVHGLIAGFGFGAYATILVFILAPQMPSLAFAPLPGLFFGLGTMVMQVLFGALFARLARLRKLPEEAIKDLGRNVAGRTLYYGGVAFALIGLLLMSFPFLESVAIRTGNSIPNLDSVGVATVLVLVVVGFLGIGSLIAGLRGVKSPGREPETR
jgi:hypothetical protein